MGQATGCWTVVWLLAVVAWVLVRVCDVPVLVPSGGDVSEVVPHGGVGCVLARDGLGCVVAPRAGLGWVVVSHGSALRLRMVRVGVEHGVVPLDIDASWVDGFAGIVDRV